jgi:hypothetical protein
MGLILSTTTNNNNANKFVFRHQVDIDVPSADDSGFPDFSGHQNNGQYLEVPLFTTLFHTNFMNNQHGNFYHDTVE